MHSNISYPALKDFIITDSFMKDGVFHLHMEVESKPHQCPSCNTLTNQIHHYRRQTKEFTQSIALELIHGKSFKDVADRFHTSTSTVIRRFDTINADMLKEPKQLPSVIAIDEYKGDAGGEKYQTIIADPVDRRPLD